MRRPLTLLLLCAFIGGCHEVPRPQAAGPDLGPAFTSFAVRNDGDLDSLSKSPAPTPEEARAWEGLLDLNGSNGQPAVLMVLGRMKAGDGKVCMLLRERYSSGSKGPTAEILLVEAPDSGQEVAPRLLGTYAMFDDRQEICSVEWHAPSLRIRGQAQWVTEQDSLLRFHIAKRTTWTELDIADRVRVVRQDTTTSFEEIE